MEQLGYLTFFFYNNNMFLLILLSVLQICFIPGFIVFLFLNRKSNDSNILLVPVISFGLSLVINYLIVFFLTYFHIYTRFALIILLVAEFIILAGIFVFHKLNIDANNVNKMCTEIINELRLLINTQKSTYDLIKFILFILSVVLLIYLSFVLILNIGEVFEESDAVFSWNRWATDFYNNKMPWSTYHYPQLIPANWSIAYVLCEYPFQFIPKTIMHLFLILPVYSFIVLGIRQRSAFFFCSAFLIFLGLGGKEFYWTDGFVDVPVAFFSIMVYISLILMKKEDQEADKQKYILLSALYACGAAVTKQSGLFIILIYPILLFILSLNKFDWTYKKIIKFSFFCLAMLIMIVLPYYIWAEIAIRNGNAASEISYVTHDIFEGASFFERLVNACRLFSDVYSSRVLFVFCFIFFLISFTDKTFRFLNLFFLIPYSVIWTFFFSYDLRNAAIIIPYFSFGTGIGLDIVLRKLQKPVKINHFLKRYMNIIVKAVTLILIISIPVVIFHFNKKVDMGRLKASQNYRLKKLGDEEVNQKLYLYNTETAIDKLIITDYNYLQLLPEIGQYFEYGDIKNLELSDKIFSDESVGFLLWNPWYSDSTKFPVFIESKIKSGSYKEIFNHKGFRFIKIR
jgi:hypothetical protein